MFIKYSIVHTLYFRTLQLTIMDADDFLYLSFNTEDRYILERLKHVSSVAGVKKETMTKRIIKQAVKNAIY